MIAAVRLMLRDGLHVDHLRLLVGTSMGCMQGFMWAESNPDDFDAFMALSCLPTQVAGRNRMVRKLMIDDVRLDPGYNHGNYTQQPYGLRAALGHLLVVASAPTLWQAEYPTAPAADKFVDEYIAENMKTTDANDFVYQYDASRNYDPEAGIGKIRAHVMLVNTMDDFWNPGEMGVAEREMPKLKNGHFVLMPITKETRGHYTFFQAALWQKYLASTSRRIETLIRSGSRRSRPRYPSGRFSSSPNVGGALLRLLDRAQIPLENLLAGPEHHARTRLNVLECFPEVAKPVRRAHDVRVYHQRHDPR